VKINITMLNSSTENLLLVEKELKKNDFEYVLNTISTKKEFKKNILHNKSDIIIADHQLSDFNGAKALKYTQEIAPEVPLWLDFLNNVHPQHHML